MGNRYIYHGAAFNGDGTSPDPATVAGGVGAWNTITILTGTAPPAGSTLPAGSTVYIRSKDAAGANLSTSVASGAYYGSTAATINDPITWILDADDVWPGVAGTLTHTATGVGTLGHNWCDFNVFVAQVQDAWRFTVTASWLAYAVIVFNNSKSRNIFVDASPGASGSISANATKHTKHVNLHYKISALYETPINGQFYLFWMLTQFSSCELVNPDIELLSAVNVPAQALFSTTYNCTFKVFGGRLRGGGATASSIQIWNANNGGSVVLSGFAIPKEIKQTALPTVAQIGYGELNAIGLDDGLGALCISAVGMYDSRDDGNYPTLNATLPGTGSPWAWKAFPKAASPGAPLTLPATKLYTQAAATKTITLEFLASDDWAGLINAGNVFADFVYTDNATGVILSHSTFDSDAGTLTASPGALWSAITYGEVALTKYKLSITTTASIKPNTLVHGVLNFGVTADSSGKIFFVCPDLILS